MTRPSGRAPEEMRPVSFTRGFAKHAEGAVLIAVGDTQVLCTASVEETVPAFLRGKDQGWVTAEWKMTDTNRRARFYKLTTAGRKHLGVEVSQFEQMIAAITRVLKEA